MVEFKSRDTPRARKLRNTAPPAERELWKYISRRQIEGAKFSRQMPVGPYFADFLCRGLNLIIELDGFSHDMRASHDQRRDAWLKAKGFHILRFTHEDVFANIEGVISLIAMTVRKLHENKPTPNPSRKREGD